TATGDVAVSGGIGQTTALNSLTFNGATVSIQTVTTTGAQTYGGAIQLNGNLDGGSLVFNGSVNTLTDLVLQSDTIDFNGGAGSVNGTTQLTLIPRTAGADIAIGGTGATLVLDAAALSGYGGEL